MIELKEEYKNLSKDELRTKIEDHFKERMKDVDVPTATHYDNGLTSLVGKGYSLTMNTNAYWAYCNSVTENITKYIQEDFNK